jgi:hypothetical protein
MGYTHYWYYRNPVVEMTQNKLKKNEIRDENRGDWDAISEAWDKLPSDEDYIKRIDKHIKAFAKIAEDIKKTMANLPDPTIIKGGVGEDEPEITPNRIWFNGDASKDLDHETFVISLFSMDTFQSFEDIAEKGTFGFCKTARKPYDFLVCVSLMVFKHHLGADFKVSSDGGLYEWQPAIDFYENLFKRKAPKQLMNYFKKEGQEA